MLSPGERRCQSFLVWSVMNCYQSFLHSFYSNIQIYHQEYHAAAALGGKCLSPTYSNVSWKVFIIFFLLPASSVKPHVYHVWVLLGWERVAFLISSDCFWNWITLAQWQGVWLDHKTSRFASVQMRDVSAQRCRCLQQLNDATRILKITLAGVFFFFFFLRRPLCRISLSDASYLPFYQI